MDINNRIIKLCLEGTQAEFHRQMNLARDMYQQAWEAAQDDYEACIAAHYVARCQDNLVEKLHWNQIALDKANEVADDRVREFYPSLYLNMGQSHELLGNLDEARHFYNLAAVLGFPHQD
jgi:hypothetical protein